VPNGCLRSQPRQHCTDPGAENIEVSRLEDTGWTSRPGLWSRGFRISRRAIAMYGLGCGLAKVMVTERHRESRREPPAYTLLTVDDVAEHLGVNVRHVRRLVQERRLPYVKWGRLLRFDPVDIAAFVDEHRST
jgi:excisionase family DNA binding protein